MKRVLALVAFAVFALIGCGDEQRVQAEPPAPATTLATMGIEGPHIYSDDGLCWRQALGNGNTASGCETPAR